MLLLDGMKRFAHRFGMLRRHKTIAPTTPSAYALDAEFESSWHGDHWQNLLASPLDARHYVMEDWAQHTTMSLHDLPDPTPTARGRRQG